MFKNLQMAISSNFPETVFFNEKLLKDNVLILFLEEERGEDIYTEVSVYHYNESSADIFVLYYGFNTTRISIYRVVKDIVELYEENTLETFIEIIDSIAVTHQSSSQQIFDNAKLQIENHIKDIFKEVRKAK